MADVTSDGLPRPGYAGPHPPFDEVLGSEGLRVAYSSVLRQLARLGPDELRRRAGLLALAAPGQGGTSGGAAVPLDPVPRLLLAEEWDRVEAGIVQRVRALEAFLDDVYGEGRALRDGVVPPDAVLPAPHVRRALTGVRPPNGVRCHFAGIDLVRDEVGRFRVRQDNVRVPSGLSSAIAHRRAMRSALPELAGRHWVRPVEAYPRELLAALRAAAPAGVTDPNVVVLTPGVGHPGHQEDALLARMMGVELVQAGDLVVVAGRVAVRATGGTRTVHVIHRRAGEEFPDPPSRQDDVLGCAGLLAAARAGTVTVANALGNGVADDRLLSSWVPDLVRYYLAEEPLLPGVDTWRLGDDAHRQEVFDRLDELVLTQLGGPGAGGTVVGPRVGPAQLDALRARILRDPRGWIAQPLAQLSTAPTLVDGRTVPRQVDLRSFAVNSGDAVSVLPGGLTGVVPPEGERVVGPGSGGWKDTWVLARDGIRGTRRRRGGRAVGGPQDGLTASG